MLETNSEKAGTSDHSINVRLVGEGLLVWRPVKAEFLAQGMCIISLRNIIPEDETWEFQPGDKVATATLVLADGPVEAAIARIGPHGVI